MSRVNGGGTESMRTSVLGRYATVQGAVGVLDAMHYRRVPAESRGDYADRWPRDSRTFDRSL